MSRGVEDFYFIRPHGNPVPVGKRDFWTESSGLWFQGMNSHRGAGLLANLFQSLDMVHMGMSEEDGHQTIWPDGLKQSVTFSRRIDEHTATLELILHQVDIVSIRTNP
jgi:hypothetical protein